MATVKRSRQRDAIRSFLMSRKDHPTAEVVYDNVSKEFPNISLGTVYRNLTFLVDNGMAMKVPCSDGSVHFDSSNIWPMFIREPTLPFSMCQLWQSYGFELWLTGSWEEF